MKQKNYNFVDIVSGIFLLVLLFSSFLALLYITEGNFVFSGLGSILLIILYFFTIQKMKDNKEALVRQGYVHSSLIFYFFFAMLAFVSFILMSHFLNVEFNAKEQVQKETAEKLQLVNDMVSAYERRSNTDIGNFDSELNSKLNEYIGRNTTNSKRLALKQELQAAPFNISENILNNLGDINKTSAAMVSPLQTKVKNTSIYLKSNLTDNNDKFAAVFNNWQRLSVMKTYANLNSYVEESLQTVNEKLAELPLNKTPIQVNYSKAQLPLNNPIELGKQFSPKYGFTLIVILIINLGVLLSFFLHKTRGNSTVKLSETALKLVREIK